MPVTDDASTLAPTVKRTATLVAAAMLATAVVACGLVSSSDPEAGWATTATSDVAEPGGAAAPPVVPTAITSDPADATIGRYGTRTSATFRVSAVGSALRYTWQQRPSEEASWRAISKAKSATYTAKAATWANGTSFRAVVTGTDRTVTSSAAKLTVLFPTRTPAKDAEAAFGLTGLTQGVDLSAYQHTPAGRVNLKAIARWAGSDGFTILRNGSGARPIKQSYTSACTNKPGKTGGKPVTQDCAYRRLADASQASGLALGHYWFNGWISTIDTTKRQLFAGGYTPTASAKQFVTWLKADGNYTRTSADPLVLDVEAGHAWTKTSKGKSYKVKLRAWNPDEATEFLTTVKALLIEDGYRPNLYVYLSANAAAKESADGGYVWSNVAGIARLWVASWGTNNGRIPTTQPKVGPWAYYGGWSIWQYTSNARIAGDGVPGGIDGDLAMPDAWQPR